YGDSPSKWLIRRVNSQCDAAIRSTILVSDAMCSYLSILIAGSAPSIFLLGFASERVLDLSLGKSWFRRKFRRAPKLVTLAQNSIYGPLKVKGTQKRRFQWCNLWCLQGIQPILTLPSDKKYTTLFDQLCSRIHIRQILYLLGKVLILCSSWIAI
ncbi:hypothetical protein EJD97_003325, partial [Solanum chilense]